LEHNSSVAKQLYFGLAMTLFIFLGATYVFYTSVGNNEDLGMALFGGALMAGTYWGWKFLSDHLPSLTMGTTNVWIFYLLVKFFLAYFIGLLVGPYQIFKMFRELRKIRKVKGQIARGEA